MAAYDTSKPLIIDPVLSYSTYLGGSGGDLGVGIAVDTSGNAYVTGFTGSANFPTASPFQAIFGGSIDTFGEDDAFVTKLNPTGSTLLYSTYLGGSSGGDTGSGIAVDSSGNAYVTGSTRSTDFPTASPLQPAFGGGICSRPPSCADAFVTKLNPTGSTLVYSTYLGGSSEDEGLGIAVDSFGNAYVGGSTFSTNFPTVSPLQPAFNGIRDAFVTKLNPTGSALVYSTYLGGSDEDFSRGIALDASGNAYVTGSTASTNFPTVSPLQGTCNNCRTFRGDAFVTKLNAAGSALVYSTYLGGSSFDIGLGIAVDSSGNAYVTGETFSTNFPTASPLQASNRGGNDVFVAKLNPTGSALVYSTYLGGSGGEGGDSIAVDASGNAYVTGITGSTNFPTASPFQATLSGSPDAFVTKLNPTGSALVYSTYLGGSSSDRGHGIAVASSGNTYVTGRTNSTNFSTASPFQAAFGGGFDDAYVAKIVEERYPFTGVLSSNS